MTVCRMGISWFFSNWKNLDGWEGNDKLEIVQIGSHSFKKLKNGKSIPVTIFPNKIPVCVLPKKKKTNGWNPKDFDLVTKTGASKGGQIRCSMPTFPRHTTFLHYESWSLVSILESPWTVPLENKQHLSWVLWLKPDLKYLEVFDICGKIHLFKSLSCLGV